MSAWVGIGRSETGLVRPTNQDAFSSLAPLGLWAVADGMGGHVGGAIAAQTAVASVTTQADLSAKLLHDGRCTPAAFLTDLFVQAHKAILGRAREEPALKGMGTTLVLLLIPPTHNMTAYVAHLGDSRAYRFQSGTLTPLTRDHTLIERYIATGLLTEQAARTHPDRHILTHALGMSAPVHPTVTPYPLQQDDLLLLCTDGLTKMLQDEDIRKICAQAKGSPAKTCDRLIDESLQRGGEDNVTVTVIAQA
jgi:serine/threonine protein phosphatase PrpC